MMHIAAVQYAYLGETKLYYQVLQAETIETLEETVGYQVKQRMGSEYHSVKVIFYAPAYRADVRLGLILSNKEAVDQEGNVTPIKDEVLSKLPTIEI